MTELSLTTRRVIKASPEAAFDAWLDPLMMSRFMAPAPQSVLDARTDARVGGRFFILMTGEEKDIPHQGTYTEISRPARLAFTWESPWSLPESTVTIDFTPVDGGTEVVLTQVRFKAEDLRNAHEKGWAGILQKLAAAFL
jgi:uncharacterized protein YndB with AHSA1/START domain